MQLLAPWSGWCHPGLQLEQFVSPSLSVYFPGRHSSHLLWGGRRKGESQNTNSTRERSCPLKHHSHHEPLRRGCLVRAFWTIEASTRCLFGLIPACVTTGALRKTFVVWTCCVGVLCLTPPQPGKVIACCVCVLCGCDVSCTWKYLRCRCTSRVRRQHMSYNVGS